MGLVWAMTLPGLVCLLIGVAFAEVLINRITGGRLLPWNRHEESRTVAATGFEQVSALFQGSKHIEFEQRQHTLMHRDDSADAAPPLTFDPAAGRVVVRRAPDTPTAG
ncbi:DUF6191 domain-containing protein [Nocardia sp. NPDC003345]